MQPTSALVASMRDWASLERGLLRDIFTRLPADVDALHFRHVCRGWRAAPGAGVPVPRPWLVLQPSRPSVNSAHSFVWPRPAAHRRGASIRPIHMDTAVKGESAAACVRGASRGWLAVNDGKRLLLWDPVSRAEVPLPAFEPPYQLFDVFLSDDPLAAPSRWTAFAFFRRNDCNSTGHALAFCRPGDAEWARFDQDVDQTGLQILFYRGLEFFRGRAYVLLADTRLAVCNVDARRLVMSSVRLDYSVGWDPDVQECLVECGGNLLVVQVARRYEVTTPSYCLRRRSYRFRFTAKAVKIVFDADGSGLPVSLSLSLSTAADTGNHALFVAPHGHAFALPASGFPAVRAGCVYNLATDTGRRSVTGMVVIDLLDPTRHHKPLGVGKLPLAGKWLPLSWFCPRSPVLDTTPARRRR